MDIKISIDDSLVPAIIAQIFSMTAIKFVNVEDTRTDNQKITDWMIAELKRIYYNGKESSKIKIAIDNACVETKMETEGKIIAGD